jgi:hypothetical protein
LPADRAFRRVYDDRSGTLTWIFAVAGRRGAAQIGNGRSSLQWRDRFERIAHAVQAGVRHYPVRSHAPVPFPQ